MDFTLKNYRSFADGNPARFQIAPGFTAFVGPNNSGKSSLLRLFYELRPLWKDLAAGRVLGQLSEAQPIMPGFEGVDDDLEVFSYGNPRDLTLQIDFPTPSPNSISRVLLTAARNKPDQWRAEFYVAPGHQKVTGTSRNGKWSFHTAETVEIHPDWESFQAFFQDLAKSLYIPPFRNVINAGSGAYYDLAVGSAFVDLWDQWKTGPRRAQNLAIQRATADIARIFEYSTFDVSAASSPRTLQIATDGNPFRIRELGAGLSQFIMVLGNAATKDAPYIFIDEPELNLHPRLQADFLTTLGAYASKGVVFATHSIGLARTNAERLYSLQANSRVRVSPFDDTPNFAEFAGEMSFSAFRELGHDRILLVEGVTEVKAVQQFLRLLGMDHKIVILPLGGTALIRGGVTHELQELRRLTEAVAVLIDSERKESGAPLESGRQKFLEDCSALHFDVHATELRAFENYLTDVAVKKVKGDRYQALEPFQSLSDAPIPWAKHENWKIAREMTASELLKTDMGAFLSGLT